MASINENFLKLSENYLFADINRRVATFSAQHPEVKIIRMGSGDVSLPLMPEVVFQLVEAAQDMGDSSTFHGYGPEQGYAFLQQAIQTYYHRYQVDLELAEIFISDGAKSDIGNITDLFSSDNTALIPDPVYPVYVDTNLMNGRKLLYINATAENDFLPLPDRSIHADLIYLCSPNNPTGAVYNREQLADWVSYAREHEAVILFDAAYEGFIGDDSLPHSIYCIEGAKECAIEFCSLSKTAGFTGTRCGYTIVPKALISCASNGAVLSLNQMWNRRQTTKFNGVSYIVQRGAAAVFTEEGIEKSRKMIDYYKSNTAIIADTFTQKGIRFFGGIHSPYIWMECPDHMKSWDFFDLLLTQAGIIGTPGAGFGTNGEGFFRLTGFSSHEDTIEAMERFSRLF